MDRVVDKDTMAEGSSARKVYTCSPGPKFVWPMRFFAVAWVLVAFGNLYVVYISDFQKVGLILVAVAYLLLAVWQLAALRSLARVRLVTSAEGLEFSAPGYSVSTTWDNAEEVTVNPSLSLEFLHLRQDPTLRHRSAVRWLLWGRLRRKRKLPLYLFQESLDGELAQDLSRYAPHLLSKE